MRIILIIAMILTTNLIAKGQQASEDFKIFKVKVKMFDTKGTIEGAFYSVNDSSISLSSSYKKKHYPDGDFTIFTIPIEKIRMIKVRRKGRGGRTAAIGFAAGATVGGLLGYGAGEITEGYIDRGGAAAALGTVLGLTGAVIGGIAGEKMKKFHIDGNQRSFEIYREVLLSYAIVKERLQADERDNLATIKN